MLSDLYRPTTWSEYIGHPAQVRAVRRALAAFDRGAFWIDGPSGTGKTTMADLICHELGVHECERVDLNGDRCTVDAVREIADTIHRRSLWSDWRAWIVNEAHSMTGRAVQAWLTLLEQLPPRRLVVFTTTETAQKDLFGQFTQPLLSRCLHVSLTADGLAQAAAPRLAQIAAVEGLDGNDLGAYARLVDAQRGNIRAALSKIEMGSI